MRGKKRRVVVLSVFLFVVITFLDSFSTYISKKGKDPMVPHTIKSLRNYSYLHETYPNAAHLRKSSKTFSLEPIDWFSKLTEYSEKGGFASDISHLPQIVLYDSLEWWSLPKTLGVLKCEKKDLECKLFEGTENIENADALVAVKDGFHMDDMRFFHKHLIHKKLIYFTLESPLVTSDFSITNGEMEMFASYWRGSDFWSPYYKWEANIVNPQNSTSPKSVHIERNYAKGKTKLVAIVVSNCYTINDRLAYVEELQKFIPVDVYGNCGSYTCPDDNCFAYLQPDYKFYLAFENSNCRDYITEKLFRNALQHEMVPVVMGASRQDYAFQAPNMSYIHVEEFKSPEHLAKYLQELDNDDSLYNKYFQWKNGGSFQPVNFLCQVCTMLHLSKVKSGDEATTEMHSRLPNGFQWGWNDRESFCLPRNDWYWER